MTAHFYINNVCVAEVPESERWIITTLDTIIKSHGLNGFRLLGKGITTVSEVDPRFYMCSRANDILVRMFFRLESMGYTEIWM
jgi:hypothetical protein